MNPTIHFFAVNRSLATLSGEYEKIAGPNFKQNQYWPWNGNLSSSTRAPSSGYFETFSACSLHWKQWGRQGPESMPQYNLKLPLNHRVLSCSDIKTRGNDVWANNEQSGQNHFARFRGYFDCFSRAWRNHRTSWGSRNLPAIWMHKRPGPGDARSACWGESDTLYGLHRKNKRRELCRQWAF